MDALSDIRERMTPAVALAGAVAIATTAVMSSPPVQRAAENTATVAVHEVKSLPLQLTSSVDFFAPYYYQPVGPLGTAITIPLYVVTYVADSLAKGLTQTLTDLHVDPRVAQVPAALSRVVFSIAGRVQGGVVSALDGTYVLGKFTPIQAINFIIEPLKQLIEAVVAAGTHLLDPSQALAATAKVADTNQDVASPSVAAATHAVTLSTAQADVTPKSLHKKKESDATPAADVSDASANPVADDTEKSDAPKADTPKADTPATDAPAVKKPTWKKPTLKLPTLKLPKLKLPAPKKAVPADTSSEGASKGTGSEGSSK